MFFWGFFHSYEKSRGRRRNTSQPLKAMQGISLKLNDCTKEIEKCIVDCDSPISVLTGLNADLSH